MKEISQNRGCRSNGLKSFSERLLLHPRQFLLNDLNVITDFRHYIKHYNDESHKTVTMVRNQTITLDLDTVFFHQNTKKRGKRGWPEGKLNLKLKQNQNSIHPQIPTQGRPLCVAESERDRNLNTPNSSFGFNLL